ncbi:putative ribonuclease H-like domain-containing protein [Tanacetum coccineum]|uniref:Ribonuclease H-like domain-containing protein n=1 Tax=Tanacetum coccineum TaxID=301880 RepID=A0ABQ5EI62_9ASTR
MGVYSVQRESRPMWNNVDNIPPFIPQAAHGRSGNVTFPAGSVNVPAPIPAGRQTGPAPVYAGTPVPAGRQNRPAPVHADRPFPAGRRNSVSVSAGWRNNAARPMSRPTSSYFQNYSRPVYYDQMYMGEGRWGTAENPLKNKDLGIVDSGCSRSMSGNKERLDDFVEIKGGTVTFGGGEGRITGKGTIRTSKLDFENVYYVKELQHFNLFSVSQICDKKNNVLFTETECLVLSKDFKLPDNSQVVLRVPRRHNLYSFNLNELQPEGTLTCLVAKASLDESTKWHRRMAHVNFKNINKLAKNGLVKGLPSKIFSNEHNCVACNKGKQHKASSMMITTRQPYQEKSQEVRDIIRFLDFLKWSSLRFLQMILGIQTTDPTPKAIGVFSSKLFANMKLKFEGDHMPLLAAMLPRENMGVVQSVPAEMVHIITTHSPLVTPQPSPRTEEVDTTPSIPSPTLLLRPWPTRESTSASSPQIEQSTPLRHPSLVRQRTPSPTRQLTPSPVRQPSPKVVHSSETNPSPFMEDDIAGGDFYVSPNRSYEAPPTTGQPAGGAEEPDALTILSSKLDRCMDQIGALETELKDTKKTLGGAVLTLVGRVKHLEVRLKKRKRTVVLSDSEDEECVHTDDLNIKALQLLANVSLASAQTVEAAFSLSQAAKDAQSQATDTSQGFQRTRSKRRLRKLSDVPAFDRFRANVSAGGVGISAGSGAVSTAVPAATVSKEIPVASTFAPSASPIPAVATSTIPAGTSTNPTAAQSSKGKEQIVEDPTPDMERIFKNMEDERIGADMAKKVQAEEDAQWARQQAESQSKRQQEVNAAAMFYTENDWLNILAQVATNSSLSQVLLGDDVTEETFPERMAALIKRKRQALAEQLAKERRERPLTQAQQKEYMRTFVKNQSSALYTTGWTMTQVKRLNDAQLKEEFEKIQQALERAKILDFKRTLPRSKPTLEEPSFRKLKPTEISSDDAVASQVSAAGTQDPAGVTISSSVAATRTPDVSAKSSSTSPLPAPFSVASTTPPSTNLSSPPPAAVTDTTTTSLPAEPNPAHPVGAVPTDETQDVSTPAAQTISSPSSTGKPKRRKRTAKKRAPKPLLDMDDQSFIKFDSGSESDSDLVPWAAIAAWEVLSTPLGEINALYRIDGVTKHFTTLREILHMVDRQDLMKLYGIVDKFYQTTVATGVGLILWGDLKVLLDSMEGGAGYSIWGSQQNWQVRSWRLYTFSNVHVLETMAGIVLYMFVDVPYPLSVKLMERMLKHKLELARDVVGNDLTTAEQLIGLIKNQLAAAQVPAA